jgi:hypothetical protein
LSTLRLVEEIYWFDERAYDRLGRSGIGWQAALEVLHARTKLRHHIGAVLRVAAQTGDGRWIVVACIEDDDDVYLVTGARELDEDEAAIVARLIAEGDR